MQDTAAAGADDASGLGGAAGDETASAGAAGGVSAEDEARLIKQLDQMLASAAEEAIAADVQGAELPAPAGKDAAVEAAGDATAGLASVSETLAPGSVGAVSAPAVAAVAVAADSAESKPAAATPAPAVTPGGAIEATPPTGSEGVGGEKAQGAVGFGATASDVARELQEDKKVTDVTGMVAQPAASGKASQAAGISEEATGKEPARSVGQILWGLCAAVSRPVGGFSPQVRTVLGYVALATLLNGLVLTMWGLVKVLR